MRRWITPRLSSALTALLVTCVLAAALTPSAHAQTPAITIDLLRNATYPVDAVPGGSAKLVNGHFEVVAAPGSASKATADLVQATIGTLGGQQRAGVVIASSGGGSGVFFELYVVDATGKTLSKASLGDRIKVNTLGVTSNNVISVDMFDHRPGEPLALATLQVTRAYGVNDAGALTFLGPFNTPAPVATPAVTQPGVTQPAPAKPATPASSRRGAQT